MIIMKNNENQRFKDYIYNVAIKEAILHPSD